MSLKCSGNRHSRGIQARQRWHWAAWGSQSRCEAIVPGSEEAMVSGYVRETGRRKQRHETHQVCARGKTTDTKNLRRDEEKEQDRKEADGGPNCIWGGGGLHFWDNEKFIAPSLAASLNQRRICIADGPCRNKINLSLISRGGLKISTSLIYVCVVPWQPEREVTATPWGAILFLHPFKDGVEKRQLKGPGHDIDMPAPPLTCTSWHIKSLCALREQTTSAA